MVSGGSNTCNVLPRRDEIKFILLLFPASYGESLVREEIWEIEFSESVGGILGRVTAMCTRLIAS